MTTALANLQGQLNPLKDVKPEDILARYLKEETSTQIAKSLGVTKAALSYYMLKYAESEWKDAQVVKAMQRKEEAEDLMERADNPLDLTRAREKLKSAQWDLERVCRRIYGQDVSPDQLGRISITLNIGGESATNAVQHDVEGTVLARTIDKA
jgi:predicted transcriptional regulator